MEPTYQEVATVLQELDFVDKSSDKYFVYYNKAYDAIVLLPLKKRNAKVNRAHFAAFCWGLEQKGVLQHEYDLGKMIEQHRLAEKGATA